MRKVDRAKCHPDVLLFLVRSCTTGAEDGDYHHYHNGDHSNRYYDYEEHVAVQGRSRTSMGTVTACKSLRWQKGVICYIEKIPIKSRQCPKTSRIMQISRMRKMVCLLGFQVKCLIIFLSFANCASVQLNL